MNNSSISIACWVVVFSPQIIENFRRGSADGLSIVFLVVWLLGDLSNILGAVLQGVLPTMIILALYYTLADIVLVGQVFYYRGFTLSDKVDKPEEEEEESPEEQPLLARSDSGITNLYASRHDERTRRGSLSEVARHLTNVDGTHLSPATPLLELQKVDNSPAIKTTTNFQAFLFNTFSILLVCGAGVVGWW